MSETTLHEYRLSGELFDKDVPFFALIMAAMRRADTLNALRLQAAFPRIWEELTLRYNAPGGFLDSELPKPEVTP